MQKRKVQKQSSPAMAGLGRSLLQSAQASSTDMIGTVSGYTVRTDTISAVSSDTVCTNTISTVSSDTVCTNTISTVSSDTVCTDTISTVSSDTVRTNAVSTVSGYTVRTNAVSTVSGYAVCTDTVSTVSSDTVCTNSISTVSGDTVDVGVRRAILGNDGCVQGVAGVHSGQGESTGGKNRKGQAKDQFVGSHEGCSSTFNEWVTRYGGDVTRRRINQKSIRLVANIVGIDSWQRADWRRSAGG
jgi:hypothetical protein